MRFERGELLWYLVKLQTLCQQYTEPINLLGCCLIAVNIKGGQIVPEDSSFVTN